MDINLLGPLEVSQNGRPITPTASKHRQVFALFAIRAGELVTAAELIEELWETSPPRSAPQCLQTYIMRLRKSIEGALPAGEGAGKAVLSTRSCGYTLNVPTENIDAHRYRDLVASGQQALDTGDFAAASRILGTALKIWRGPALVDVRVGPRLGPAADRLEQSRLGVLESRIDADLGLGRYHQLLDELAELTTRYPMHEKLCVQYMTALTACGRKWRALEVFWALRQRLVTELGVEPSIEVQRVQQRILNADTKPAEPASVGVRRRGGPPVWSAWALGGSVTNPVAS